MPGPWAIGCVLCANFVAQGRNGPGRCSAFSKFEVRRLNTLQGTEIKRHCDGEFHAEVVKALARPASGCQPVPGLRLASREEPDSGVEPDAMEPDATGVATTVRDVPRPDKFVWGVTVCHIAGSYRDYDRFCRAADLTSYL